MAGRRLVKRGLRKAFRVGRELAARLEDEDLADAAGDCYAWLRAQHVAIRRTSRALRPDYLWGALNAALLASALGLDSVSLVELGVAGGAGLVALESVKHPLERIFDLEVSIYGFDTGVGLPPPQDLRDLPNLFAPGEYRMDAERLRDRLTHAELLLGRVEDTLPAFVASEPAPVGFISFDLDYYSSTTDAFRLLDADTARLLPRVQSYFDDVTGFTYGDCNGELLAISEFNEAHETRKLSRIYDLQGYVPRRHRDEGWARRKFYLAHILDHELYGRPDGLARGVAREHSG